jgi:hypothetical protein
MDSRTNCYGLVWEKNQDVYNAVGRALRYQRNVNFPNIPIELSSDVFSLECQRTCLLNPCHDAYVILQALMRTARHYHSVVVLNKGHPCVRWVNTSHKILDPSVVLVIDSEDVVQGIAQMKLTTFNQWTLLFNIVFSTIVIGSTIFVLLDR